MALVPPSETNEPLLVDCPDSRADAYVALQYVPVVLFTEHEFADIAPALLEKAHEYGGWHVVIRGAVPGRRGALAALRRVEVIEAWRKKLELKSGSDVAAKAFGICERRGRGLARTRALMLAKQAHQKLK